MMLNTGMYMFFLYISLIMESPFSLSLSLSLSLQYVIEGFTELEFGELLNYLTTGSCTINHTNIVGLACVAERYEVEELKKACYDNLSRCLTIRTVCTILTQLEKFLAFTSAKTMIIQSLEFVDSNAVELLSSEDMKNLSENMVHLVLRRDTDVPEVLKVKAAFAWGEVNARPGQGGWSYTN